MGAFFVPSSTQKATFEKRYDSNGKVWANCLAHGDLTAKTPYAIIADEYGPLSGALPASGKYIHVGVPEAAVDSGAGCWLQIGGDVSAMITASLSVAVGHGLTVASGAIADIAADYSGAAGEFCVNTAGTSTQTIHTVILVPERIITI